MIPEPQPKKSRTFISELRVQIEMIDEELSEIKHRGTMTAKGVVYREQDKARREWLKDRRTVIRNRIIEHDNGQ